MSDSTHPSGKEPSPRPAGGPLERPQPKSEQPREPEMIEDSGAQALSDALRSSFVIVKVLMIGLVIVFFCSGVFTVPSQKRAIVMRFGKPVGTDETMLLEPGLHFAFPEPIDEKVFIPTGQQTVRSTVGWYAITPEQEAAKEEPFAGPSLTPGLDGYTITADANIIHVRATLNYRITKPVDYALNFANSSNVVKNLLDNALVYASSRTKVDDALRLDRIGFQEKVVTRVQELVEKNRLGITLDPMTIDVIPPRQVKEKFDGVNAADAERRQTVDKAQSEASRIVNSASSEATNMVNLAFTDRARLVESVRAEAQYFADQLPYYNRDPRLFMARLQTEVLHRALTNTQDKIFVGRDAQLRLQLNREPEQATQPQQQPPTR